MAQNEMMDSIDSQLYFNDQELKTINFSGISENDVRDTVRILQDWIRQQPHLPECAVSETRMLWRIRLIRKMSLERTKQTVDMFYTVRNLIPEFFQNRDPVILQEQQVFERVHVLPFPILLDDFTQIINTRFLGSEDDQFDTIKFIKIGTMVGELIFRSTNALGFQLVMDLKNVSLGVMMKITPSILKKIQVVITDTMDTELSFSGKEMDFLRFLGLHEDNVRDVVKTIQDWIRQQPHLPECAASETRMLWRILCIRKMSLERTKQTVDMYYTVRNLIPEFFRNRDPVILQEQEVFTYLQCVPLPGLLDDLTQVVINRFVSTDDKHFELIQFMKISAMIGDLLVSNACSLGFHVVVDLSNYSLGVIRQFTPVILKKAQLILTKAYPVRIKSIHFVNAPVFVDKLITLFKMILVPKLSKRIIVHTSGLGSLHDHISPKYIPLEYGGELGPVQDMWDSWTKELISKRDWFLEQENISSDEKRRPGKPLDQSELFGMEGSFKKLSVD